MARPSLLLTGVSGRIGRILREPLSASYHVIGLDTVQPNPAMDTSFQASIADYEQVAAIMRSIAPVPYVVHLAAEPNPQASWEEVHPPNIVGTRNVYEAARAVGVERVVFASSNHVTGAYEGLPPTLHEIPDPEMITVEHPIRPDGYYGVSKAFGEAIARMYHELHGIASICLRIGTVLEDDDPTTEPRHRRTWLSHRDLVQLVQKSLEADVDFGIYYGVSDNDGHFWDIANTREELGYDPQDNAAHR